MVQTVFAVSTEKEEVAIAS